MTDLNAEEHVTEAVDRLQQAMSAPRGAVDWPVAVKALSDILNNGTALLDSQMALMGLHGATWAEVSEHARMSAQQVSRRVALTPELGAYATRTGGGALRVSRDALAVARDDFKNGRLRPADCARSANEGGSSL